MTITKDDFTLEVTEPVDLMVFTDWTEEYNTWKTQNGVYFIFRRSTGPLELEYVGLAANGQHGLAWRVAQHTDTNPLIRRYVEAGHYAVCFHALTNKFAIKNLEMPAIMALNPPGNETLFARNQRRKRNGKH
jgi:hypothetical protein